MKKLFLFSAAVLFAAVTMGQTVSSSTITFANCQTKLKDTTLLVGEKDYPVTIGSEVFTQEDTRVISLLTEKGCDSIVTLTVATKKGVASTKGVFSVSETKKVYFAQGNLQYQTKTDTWRLAEQQYAFYGNTGNNTQRAADSDKWIDMYAFGCSGSGTTNKPASVCPSYSSISNEETAETNRDIAWYNNISNGGGQHVWYTLSKAEMGYLIGTRDNAENLRTVATVCGYKGLLLLPDNWSGVHGVTITITTTNYTTNTYTEDVWNKLEKAGAVFLPYAGKLDLNCSGGYASYNANAFAYQLSSQCGTDQGWMWWGPLASTDTSNMGAPLRPVCEVK